MKYLFKDTITIIRYKINTVARLDKFHVYIFSFCSFFNLHLDLDVSRINMTLHLPRFIDNS